MKILSEVTPEVKVRVEKIGGGSEVKSHLEELGIAEGTELTVVATEPVHVHAEPISVKAAGREAVIARGWANKVYVEKEGETLPLLRLEAGAKGTIKTIEGGKTFETWIEELGVKTGSEIELLGHRSDVTLVLKVDGEEISMDEDQASKALVEKAGESMQINYLGEGEKGKISKIIGGTSVKEKFEQIGVAEGKEITLVRKEAPTSAPKVGTYVLAKIGEHFVTIEKGLAEKVSVESEYGDQLATIGKGLAEKIWVESEYKESPEEKNMIVILQDRFYTDPKTFEKIKRSLGEKIEQDSYFYYITKNLYVASERYKRLEAVLLEIMRHNETLSLYFFNENMSPDLVREIRDVYEIAYLPALIVSSKPITSTSRIIKQEKSITFRRDDMLIDELCSDEEKLKALFDELHELSKRDDLGNWVIFKKKAKRILGELWEKVSISPP